MRLLPALPLLLIALPLIAFLSACESTQSKSKGLAKHAKGLGREHGVVVRRQNRLVRVSSTATIQDPNGTAVVVTLRNVAKHALADLPISIDVVGRKGTSMFRNDLPGLDSSLVRVPLLEPRRSVVWVNDQVDASGKARKVKVKVGGASTGVPKVVPKISISSATLRDDPVDGPEAAGIIVNRSGVEQRKLVIFGVSRRGGHLVAAGRAVIGRLKPHKHARFQLFFIGDPRGGRLSITAPPTVLKREVSS
jgi:hypothetical protein